MPEDLTTTETVVTRVLLVDNDQDHADAMAESLDRIGFNCTIATSGPEGSRQIDERTFDVVVTDLVMNDVDGMQILAEARKKQPNCEVVMVTGHASIPKAVEAMQQGAFNFLEKPITPKRLQAVAGRLLHLVVLKEMIRLLQANHRAHLASYFPTLLLYLDARSGWIDPYLLTPLSQTES